MLGLPRVPPAEAGVGLERGLDATTTRTLMGQAYPQPGLQGKFYDVDMDPLIEVVRDTVGRHDTFALACTAKYYEDKGYPGHVNCSENFNGQVVPFGVAPRMGWEALNFFYNTGFDASKVFVMDEPWSRPGDYVLLRAMTDLVCASSACPDDIDPANGWQITPVHVRVYAPDNTFSVAIARRVTADAEPVLTRETTFHPRTSELTKSFVEYRGYWLPHCFDNEGAIAEYWACREKAAVMDLSPLRKWEVLGPDAETLIQHAITRDARRLSVGQVTYTARLQRDRRDDRRRDGLPPRPGQLPLRRRRRVRRDLAEGARRAARAQGLGQAVDRPAAQRRRAGAGEPRAPEEDRLDAADADVARGSQVVPLHGRADRDVRRDSDRRLAHRLHGRARLRGLVPPSDGPAVWDAIWEAGEEHGLTPLGLEALDILRIESGLIFAGYEFDDQVDPFEAGIGFAVDLRDGRRLRRARSARGAAGASAARPRRARARGQRDRRPRRRGLRRPPAGRRRHERDAQPDPEEEHRARARRRAVRGARNGARGRQARRAPEADPGDRRPLPVLRPGQDEAPLVSGLELLRTAFEWLPVLFALDLLLFQLVADDPSLHAGGGGGWTTQRPARARSDQTARWSTRSHPTRSRHSSATAS